MGLVLFILSISLSFLVVIGLLYGLFKSIYKNMLFNEGLPKIDAKFFKMAKAFDIYGNVAAEELFNDLFLLKSSTHKFGGYGETISEVIGWNLMFNTLSKNGKRLDSLLNFFDEDHSLKAIGLVGDTPISFSLWVKKKILILKKQIFRKL